MARICYPLLYTILVVVAFFNPLLKRICFESVIKTNLFLIRYYNESL
jgi:hypothetical protein